MSSVPVGQENVCAPADPARTRQMQATANKTTNLYTATSSMNPVKGLSLVRKNILEPRTRGSYWRGRGRKLQRYLTTKSVLRGGRENFFRSVLYRSRLLRSLQLRVL